MRGKREMSVVVVLTPPPRLPNFSLWAINGGGWRRGWLQLPTFSVWDSARAHTPTAWLAAGAFLGHDVGSKKLIRPSCIYSAWNHASNTKI